MARSRGWEIVERAKTGERLIFDGGYGTALFAAGLSNGGCPELWNDTHPGVVRGIHKGYFDAGSDFVETNTFGGARLKLNEYKIGDRTGELNQKGARLARSVCPPGGYVAGSIGPTSCLPLDYGVGDNVATDEQYFATFKEQAEALAEGGVDIFAVETMMFPQEATAAIQACKAVADLPVMATMFFQYEEMHDRDRTMWGESPAEGSSNTKISGSIARARATAARFFMPPESSCGCSLPKSASPTTASFIQTIRSIMEGASAVCSRKVRATLSCSDSELNKAAL